MGRNPSDMASIAVTHTEPQVFTNAWRDAIPYGPDGGSAHRLAGWERQAEAPE